MERQYCGFGQLFAPKIGMYAHSPMHPRPYRSAHEAALGVARIGATHELGQLPPTLHEVQQEQVTVRTKADQIDAALKACGNASLLSQWAPLRQRAYAYASQEFGVWGYLGWMFVTPNDLENGKQLERDMTPWFKIAADCSGKLPTPAPLPPSSGGLGDTIEKTFSGASQLLMLWLAYELLVKRGA